MPHATCIQARPGGNDDVYRRPEGEQTKRYLFRDLEICLVDDSLPRIRSAPQHVRGEPKSRHSAAVVVEQGAIRDAVLDAMGVVRATDYTSSRS